MFLDFLSVQEGTRTTFGKMGATIDYQVSTLTSSYYVPLGFSRDIGIIVCVLNVQLKMITLKHISCDTLSPFFFVQETQLSLFLSY